MKEIQGNAKNLRSLLAGAKFAIDYYQREYRWEKKVKDHRGSGGEIDYKSGDPRREIKNYFPAPSSSATGTGTSSSSTVSSG